MVKHKRDIRIKSHIEQVLIDCGLFRLPPKNDNGEKLPKNKGLYSAKITSQLDGLEMLINLKENVSKCMDTEGLDNKPKK